MATFNFYLKVPGPRAKRLIGREKKPQLIGKIPTLIYLYMCYDGRRFKVSASRSIKPCDWDEINQRARKSLTGYSDFNLYLTTFAKDYEAAYTSLTPNGETVTPRQIIDKVKQARNVNQPKQKEETLLIPFIEKYISTAGDTGKAYGTVKSYKTTLSVLQRYEVHAKEKLTFENIDLGFYNNFISYQSSILSYSRNNIGKNVKNLKVFLGEATELGLNTNMAYKKKKFKVFKEDVESIYLNETQLRHLYGFDFSGSPNLERVRDLFIVACRTGLRFSDFKKIEPECFEGDLLKIKTQKTGTNVDIVLDRTVKAIREKYKGETDNSLPKSYSSQKMNKYLKEMGRIAGFTDKVLITVRSGGKKETKKVERYKLISTHTGRRSMATNMFLAKVPPFVIMKITGHHDMKSFLKYIKITSDEATDVMRDYQEAEHQKQIEEYNNNLKKVV